MLATTTHAGILDDLQNTYITNINELPNAEGSPEKVWQYGGVNFIAWIDIVGFHNLSWQNGTNYTLWEPDKEAIVKYGIKSILDCNYGYCYVNDITAKVTTQQEKLLLFNWDEIPGADNSKLINYILVTYGKSMEWIKLVNITKSYNNKRIYISNENRTVYLKINNESTEMFLEIDSENTERLIVLIENGKTNIYKNRENIIAKLHAVMTWTMKLGDQEYHHEEIKDYFDYEISPKMFEVNNFNITIDQYKNVNIISLKNASGIMKYKISTPNGSVERRTHAGILNYTPKGVPYIEIIPFESWKCTGTGICNIRNEIMSENTSLNFTFETPYGIFQNTGNITITKQPESSVEPYIFQLILIIGLFSAGLIILRKGVNENETD